ncbi:hypothetical protein L1N85_15720 [Paenibacillus alkaliterrae]|uniref:hypothetical protein n=1 Tax=Paenibacillus alkaliterrae TaxID=320909 RepID=UPI001F2A4FA3|nr:hypothetical protein [Paenibacillus alkaliterrae]MCF2939866.1 hypothetical protein [Paenibacillus alkaliterrae]
MIFSILLVIVGCNSAQEIPLPPMKEISETACMVYPTDTTKCYLVPLSYKEAIDWFDNSSNTKGWTITWISDVEPYSLIMEAKKTKMKIQLYRQIKDTETGIQVESIK